ncbi:hypothetical protein M3Y98_01068700 [Aphelenchoides besseyi]|nr:hypothetical protein M3Y98_01068700 [Aphelenchoides besseyi]
MFSPTDCSIEISSGTIIRAMYPNSHEYYTSDKVSTLSYYNHRESPSAYSHVPSFVPGPSLIPPFQQRLDINPSHLQSSLRAGFGLEAKQQQVTNDTSSKDPRDLAARLFIGNLNTMKCTRKEVIDLCSPYGNLKALSLFRGYAFVQYETESEAELATRVLKGYNFHGSKLGKDDLETTNVRNRSFAQEVFEAMKEVTFHDHGKNDTVICGTCRTVFPAVRPYIEHRRQKKCTFFEREVAPASISCFTCKEKFTEPWQFVQHLIHKHSINLYRGQPESDPVRYMQGHAEKKAQQSNEEKESTTQNVESKDTEKKKGNENTDENHTSNEAEDQIKQIAAEKEAGQAIYQRKDDRLVGKLINGKAQQSFASKTDHELLIRSQLEKNEANKTTSHLDPVSIYSSTSTQSSRFPSTQTAVTALPLQNKSKRALKLCLITFLYLVFGAIVFGLLEHDADLELRKDLQKARQTMQKKYNFTLEDYAEFEGMVITSIPFSAGYQWKFFPGAFYFCVVVIATVGYGHSCPSTVAGKCFYMLFSLFGIPLGLVMFQSIGWLSRREINLGLFTGERINTVVRLGLVKFCALLTRLGYKSLNEIKTRHLLIVSSTIGTITIAIGTVVFHKQETWSLFDSFYYCVITLSTIGLGDHVPAQTGERLEKDIVYVLFTLIFILFGLAVFSACINLLILEFMANNNADSAMGRGRRLRRFLSFRKSGSLKTPSTNDAEVSSPKNKAKEQLRRNGSLIDARAVYYSAYASKPINFTVLRQPIKYVDHLVNLHSETTAI